MNDTHHLAEPSLVHVLLAAGAANEPGLVIHLLAPFAKGFKLHRHRTRRELCYVLEGVLAIHLGGDVRVLGAGELLTIPAGTEHTYWNPAAAVARLLLIYSPGASAEDLQHLVSGDGELVAGQWDTS